MCVTYSFFLLSAFIFIPEKSKQVQNTYCGVKHPEGIYTNPSPYCSLHWGANGKMRFLDECKTRGRNIISSFLSKEANLSHHSVVLELISFWITCSDCLVRWFWFRKSWRSHSASGWRNEKTIWGMLYTSSRLCFGRIGSAVWGNRWVFGNDKIRNILNLF